jgi:hypothetical protein
VSTPQAKLILSLAVMAIAFVAWLFSFYVFPSKGLVRTAALFVIAWLLLGRYDNLFRTVSQEFPLNQNVVGGVYAAWLFVVLAGVLYAQSAGHRIPTGPGINRPLGVIALTLPLLGAIGWRLRQMYAYLGRSGA